MAGHRKTKARREWRQKVRIARAPKKRGKARMMEIQRENLKTVLETRARQLGAKDPDAMNAEILSEQAGQALHLSCGPEEAKELWGHYKALTSSEVRYHRTLGVSVYPKTAKIEFLPEVFEVRDDVSPDLRTEEERDCAAKKSWDYWRGLLDQLSISESAAIYTAKFEFCDLVNQGHVTVAGKRFVLAMKRLGELV